MVVILCTAILTNCYKNYFHSSSDPEKIAMKQYSKVNKLNKQSLYGTLSSCTKTEIIQLRGKAVKDFDLLLNIS